MEPSTSFIQVSDKPETNTVRLVASHLNGHGQFRLHITELCLYEGGARQRMYVQPTKDCQARTSPMRTSGPMSLWGGGGSAHGEVLQRSANPPMK